MKKSIHAISAVILALGLSYAWAADPSAVDKPAIGNMNQGGMPQSGMQNGEGKGMNMDKEHMDQMNKHMDQMHKSTNMGDTAKGDAKCDMKSDAKCAAKDMKSTGKPAGDKPKAPANADDHSEHHQ